MDLGGRIHTHAEVDATRGHTAPTALLLMLVFLTSQIVWAPPAAAGPVRTDYFEGEELYHPWDVAVDPDDPTNQYAFVADTNNHRIVKYRNGVAQLSMGQGPPAFADGEAEEGFLYYPQAVAVFGGEVFVADTSNSRIQVFDAVSGEFLDEFGEMGSGSGQLNNPGGIAVTDAYVAVADTRNHRIALFSRAGTFVKNFGELGSDQGELTSPVGIAARKRGGWWVTDGGDGLARVQWFDDKGQFIFGFGTYGTAPGQMSFPDEIDEDANENVYVAQSGANEVQKFDYAGTLIWELGSSTAGYALGAPHGVAVDKMRGRFLVADTNESLVYEFDEQPPQLKLHYGGSNGFDLVYT